MIKQCAFCEEHYCSDCTDPFVHYDEEYCCKDCAEDACFQSVNPEPVRNLP